MFPVMAANITLHAAAHSGGAAGILSANDIAIMIAVPITILVVIAEVLSLANWDYEGRQEDTLLDSHYKYYLIVFGLVFSIALFGTVVYALARLILFIVPILARLV